MEDQRLTHAALGTRPSALVIVGMQRALAGAAGAGVIEQVARLVGAASRCGVPIILGCATRRADHADDAFPPAWDGLELAAGSAGHEPLPGLGLPADVQVLPARALSAFQHTPLDLALTKRGIHDLVLAGGPVDSLLSSTARQGAALGYEQFVAPQACYPGVSTLQTALRNRVALASVEDVCTAWAARAAGPSVPPREDGDAPQALLVIDMQNDFVHPDGVMARLGHSKLRGPDRESLLTNATEVVADFRRRALPVIFIRDVQSAHGLDTVLGPMMRRALPVPRSHRFIAEGTWGADFLDRLRPVDGDLEVVKRGNSAFAGTPLHRLLRNLRVRRCAIVGGAVGGCISDTVRDGIGLGYRFEVISDATFPADPPYLAVLETLTTVRTSAELLAGVPTATREDTVRAEDH